MHFVVMFVALITTFLYACQAINSQPKDRVGSQKTIHCIYIAQRSVLTYIQESLFDGQEFRIGIGNNIAAGYASTIEGSNRCTETMA
jgi:hypothetical protein